MFLKFTLLTKSRKYEGVTLNGFIKNIVNVITIGRNIVINDTNKFEIYNDKSGKVVKGIESFSNAKVIFNWLQYFSQISSKVIDGRSQISFFGLIEGDLTRRG